MGPAIVLQTQDNCPSGLLGVWAERHGIELDVDAFAGFGGTRSARHASAGVGSWDSREAH